MARHVVPTRWKSGMVEIGARVFAYVQASGMDPKGDTGVANSGLIVGPEAAVAVDALMVPSMTKRRASRLPNSSTPTTTSTTPGATASSRARRS